jgi:hypothetical protein
MAGFSTLKLEKSLQSISYYVQVINIYEFTVSQII